MIGFVLNLPPWLSGLTLSELQCSEPAWLVRQGMGSPAAAAGMPSQVSACYEIKFSGRYRGFACVLLNCDRPSHPDWGHLCVVRAAGVGNRWQVPAALLVGQGCTTELRFNVPLDTKWVTLGTLFPASTISWQVLRKI